jgi:hypothetical protein
VHRVHRGERAHDGGRVQVPILPKVTNIVITNIFNFHNLCTCNSLLLFSGRTSFLL